MLDIFYITTDFQTKQETNPLQVKAHLGAVLDSYLKIINKSGSEVDLWYVARQSRSRSKLTPNEPLYNGGMTAFNAYVGNEFEIHEAGYSCQRKNNCRTVVFDNPGNDASKLQ